MDMHGGQLSLHSKGVGFGSTFTVKLNLYEGGATDLPTSTALIDNVPHISPSLTTLGYTSNFPAAETDLSSDPHLDNEDVGKSVILPVVLPPTQPVSRVSSLRNSNYDMAAAAVDDMSLVLPLEKLRFLVVDDSNMNRKMLVRLLVSEKHTCDQAEDGEVAVKMVVAAKERSEANGVESAE